MPVGVSEGMERRVKAGRSQSGKMSTWWTGGLARSLRTQPGPDPGCPGLNLALVFLVDYSGGLPREVWKKPLPCLHVQPQDEGTQDSSFFQSHEPLRHAGSFGAQEAVPQCPQHEAGDPKALWEDRAEKQILRCSF